MRKRTGEARTTTCPPSGSDRGRTSRRQVKGQEQWRCAPREPAWAGLLLSASLAVDPLPAGSGQVSGRRRGCRLGYCPVGHARRCRRGRGGFRPEEKLAAGQPRRDGAPSAGDVVVENERLAVVFCRGSAGPLICPKPAPRTGKDRSRLVPVAPGGEPGTRLSEIEIRKNDEERIALEVSSRTQGGQEIRTAYCLGPRPGVPRVQADPQCRSNPRRSRDALRRDPGLLRGRHGLRPEGLLPTQADHPPGEFRAGLARGGEHDRDERVADRRSRGGACPGRDEGGPPNRGHGDRPSTARASTWRSCTRRASGTSVDCRSPTLDQRHRARMEQALPGQMAGELLLPTPKRLVGLPGPQDRAPGCTSTRRSCGRAGLTARAGSCGSPRRFIDVKGPMEFVLVYPSDRKKDTPLATFTPVDIVRNTLGVGPCEYVLDREGLQGRSANTGRKNFGRGVCDTTTPIEYLFIEGIEARESALGRPPGGRHPGRHQRHQRQGSGVSPLRQGAGRTDRRDAARVRARRPTARRGREERQGDRSAVPGETPDH